MSLRSCESKAGVAEYKKNADAAEEDTECIYSSTAGVYYGMQTTYTGTGSTYTTITSPTAAQLNTCINVAVG